MIDLIDLPGLAQYLTGSRLEEWAETLPNVVAAKLDKGHGDLERWSAALSTLPSLQPDDIHLKDTFRLTAPITADQKEQLEISLRQLSPWRKGPFDIFGVYIDTEWRSDWKWSRVSQHIDLCGKLILDVGCGNGYYQWCMLGAGARAVLGIDPNWLFFCQFLAIKRYMSSFPAWSLPMTLEELPANLSSFDTVFSMGVLYHRRSPIDHLLALKECLRSGGELVLETLVVEGTVQTVLVPEDRYAQMRNVWFLPSPAALELWLRRAGFQDIRLADLSHTTTEEQRSTSWMRFQSLPDFLDPKDPTRTIEGLPAPLRATFIARRP
ncbi:tRNA (mo5U34)-methyltransferase [Pseudomonas duriflava]|uniref:tRNA U34 carboxymethyltransferase n=1 Tax=Pseudomonas duriflava TaxID=459528 RepID=A0A562Q978_9PSED|nr:tRNA 5-methoxyuridine(34)/uridine 5-oxyacetic acid(34) synthase CmoB [Pseudomonas duriflava]TWI53331.1 tRNA (mo5U34)-methyltransferase [Pseudomonas duriflava]